MDTAVKEKGSVELKRNIHKQSIQHNGKKAISDPRQYRKIIPYFTYCYSYTVDWTARAELMLTFNRVCH